MKKTIVYIGISLFIIFELLRVYLIMPLPGSQQMNSINLAYWLGKNQQIIRIVGWLIISRPLIEIFRNSTTKNKIFVTLLLIVYGAVAFLFNFKMEADKMFYQPQVVRLVSADKNQVGDEK